MEGRGGTAIPHVCLKLHAHLNHVSLKIHHMFICVIMLSCAHLVGLEGVAQLLNDWFV